MATASAIDWPALEKALRRVLPPRAVVSKAQELLSYDCDGLTMDRPSAAFGGAARFHGAGGGCVEALP